MKVNKVNKENYCNNNKAYFCGPSARSSACDVVVSLEIAARRYITLFR